MAYRVKRADFLLLCLICSDGFSIRDCSVCVICRNLFENSPEILFTTEAGQVLTWGFDDDGRLGHGSPGHHFTPKLVESLTGKVVTDLSCGCWHSAVRCIDGNVF